MYRASAILLLALCLVGSVLAGPEEDANHPDIGAPPDHNQAGGESAPLSAEDEKFIKDGDAAHTARPTEGHESDTPYHEDDELINEDHEDEDSEQVSVISDDMVCTDGNCEVGLDEHDKTLLVGAVAYDPKVVTFWESVKSYAQGPGRELDMDFVLYSNYDRLVEAALHGFVHMIWASPVAWVELEAVAASRGLGVEALVMRDSDQDLKSLIVVRSDGDIKQVADLKGKTVAVGAADSPQSAIIPLYYIKETANLSPQDMRIQRHDLLLGKHGDHLAGEREAAQGLANSTADASCMAESSYELFIQEGIFTKENTRVLASTHNYDHFVFAALQGYEDHHSKQAKRLKEILLGMDGSKDAFVKSLMDIENVKQWLPGRTTGFAHLKLALEEFGHIKEFLQHHGALPDSFNETAANEPGGMHKYSPYHARPPADEDATIDTAPDPLEPHPKHMGDEGIRHDPEVPAEPK